MARAINARGDVVGTAVLADRTVHGFLHLNGTMIDIGAVAGDSCSTAMDVNDTGQVIGYSDFACETNDRPSSYVNGSHQYLFGLLVFGKATAVNASGQIAGWVITALGNRAFLQSAGTTTYLPTLGGQNSYAYDLNNRGDIVGESTTVPPTPLEPFPWPHAFVYAAGAMHDIGTLGGTYSSARAINDRGEIAGLSTTDDGRGVRPFVYRNGLMSDLGSLGGTYGEGLGINDAGWIVGRSQTGAGDMRAFLHADGVMHDLNALVVTKLEGKLIDFAFGINSRGQIAASACDRDVGSHCVPVRLDPVAEPHAAHEVPGLSQLMLGVVAVALGWSGAARVGRSDARGGRPKP